MQNHTLGYNTTHAFHAVFSVLDDWSLTDGPINGIISVMWRLLNGHWICDVDYQGYGGLDHLCEMITIKGNWYE